MKTSVSYVMAAVTRRRVGRPKLPGSLKSIRLRESVFNLLRDRKEALGFSEVCRIPATSSKARFAA